MNFLRNLFKKDKKNKKNDENGTKTKSEVESTKINGEYENFNEGVLKSHNEYRLKHNVGPLELDSNLTKYAQDWANHLSTKNRFEHRTNNEYGENLWCFSSSDPNAKVNPQDPCDSWYNEIEYYNFNDPKNPNMKAGHFTQMIWKNSTKLGVGYAKTGNRMIVVCNYDPAGNYIGQYQENVLKVKS